MTIGLNMLTANRDLFIPGMINHGGHIRVNKDDNKLTHDEFRRDHAPFNQPIRSNNKIDSLIPLHEIISGSQITKVDDVFLDLKPEYVGIYDLPRTEMKNVLGDFSQFLYTFVPSYNSNLPAISLASLQAPILLEATVDFESDVRDFIVTYGADAILALSQALAADEQNQRRWEFITMVGEDESADTQGARRQFLLDTLDSHLAGDRLASASALGRLGDPSVLPALKAQAQREESRIAKSVMLANIKALEKHGAIPQTTN